MPVSGQEAPAEGRRPPGLAELRRLTFFGVLGGACALVPLPLLDDWLLGRVKRLQARSLLPHLPAKESAILGGAWSWRLPGCLALLGWLFRRVLLRILTAFFRKILYILAIRESIHWATETIHEGYLLLDAHRTGTLDRHRGTAGARAVRRALVEAIEESDLRPVRRAVRRALLGSWRALGEAIATLGRWVRRAKATPEVKPATARGGALESLVDRLAETLWGDPEAFRETAARFHRRLAQRGPAPPFGNGGEKGQGAGASRPAGPRT